MLEPLIDVVRGQLLDRLSARDGLRRRRSGQVAVGDFRVHVRPHGQSAQRSRRAVAAAVAP